MARFIGNDVEEERPETRPSEELKAWWVPAAKALFEEHSQRDHTDRYFPNDVLGDRVGFSEGYRFPDPPGPLRVFVTKLPGELPDFLGRIYVSDLVKSKIEELEPRTHQFFPIEVVLPDGSTTNRRYWLFNNMNRIDALVLEQSQGMVENFWNKERWPEFFDYRELGGVPVVWALDKRKIAGMATWYDYKLRRYFVSDALGQIFDECGVKGWEADIYFVGRANLIEV